MDYLKTNCSSSFVAIASLTAELSDVMHVAKEISLAAANAKAIAFRAGEKTKGFQPITDFINDLAKDTISLVGKINRNAGELYLVAANENRVASAYDALLSVEAVSGEAMFNASLKRAIVVIKERNDENRQSLGQHIHALIVQLDEIVNYARAARVIAANSRIEASQADEYAQSLQAVAESVDYAAKVINEKAISCKKRLQTLGNDQ